MTGDDDLLKKACEQVKHGANWGIALADIALHFRRTNDQSTCKFLAGVVIDESHPRDLRVAAYYSLFEVSGRDVWALPLIHQFRIPDDLDMGLLSEYLR
jgi:hypothetical protein